MIETERLRLRNWRLEDGGEFLRVTNTPAVMAHLGGVQPVPGTINETIARQRRHQDEHGHCLWVVERREDDALLGFCGLQPGRVGPIAGAIEIGWRLREDAWGRGYAKEAALASLAWGWRQLACARIVAITVPANRASWGLMERIGMTRQPALAFDHPAFAEGDPLRSHLVYAIDRP